MIRPLLPADAGWAARQHARLMTNSVFALFGDGFLAAVYGEFARSRHAVAFVYEGEQGPLAVIACTSDRRAFLRGLALRSGWRLAAYGALSVLRRPACRRLLFQSNRYLKTTGRTEGAPAAEMVFITVDPLCRGAGVARRLIVVALDEFRRRGVEEVAVTIESANESIRRILLSLGFRQGETFPFAGKDNDLLTLGMGNSPAPAGEAH